MSVVSANSVIQLKFWTIPIRFTFFNRPARQDLVDPSRRPRDAWNPAVARGTLAVSGEFLAPFHQLGAVDPR